MEFLSERRRRSIQDAIDVLQQGLAVRQSGGGDNSARNSESHITWKIASHLASTYL